NSSISDDGSNVTLSGTLLSLQLGGTADGMQNGLEFYGQSSGLLRVTAPTAITSHTLTLPSAQGAANTFPRNDGTGALTWSKTLVQPIIQGLTTVTLTDAATIATDASLGNHF